MRLLLQGTEIVYARRYCRRVIVLSSAHARSAITRSLLSACAVARITRARRMRGYEYHTVGAHARLHEARLYFRTQLTNSNPSSQILIK